MFLVPDVLLHVLQFIENDYIPVFRLVCKRFKEVLEYEAECGNGVEYKYGKFVKYRGLPPFIIDKYAYLSSIELQEWAERNGFSGDLNPYLIMKANICKEVFWKLFSKRYDSSTTLTWFLKRWYSVEDLEEHINRIQTCYYLTFILRAAVKYVPIEVMDILINRGAKWAHDNFLLIMESKHDRLYLLRNILEVEGRRVSYQIPSDDMPISYKVICIYQACVSEDLDTFKYLFQRYYFSLSTVDKNRVFANILKCGTIDILEFLREQGLLTLPFTDDRISANLKKGNLHFAKWYGKYYHLPFNNLTISEFSPMFENNKHVDLLSWCITADLFQSFQLGTILNIAVRNKWYGIFDLVFSKLNGSLAGVTLLTPHWKSFNSVERFGLVYKRMIDLREVDVHGRKFIQQYLVLSRAYECLQWIHEHGYPIHKDFLFRINDVKEYLHESLIEWLTSLPSS